MIKRKRSKTRKNPHTDDTYKAFLKTAILFGSGQVLSGSLTYYKQGPECKDCNEDSRFCKCEKCNECGFNRCLCNIDFKNKDEIRRKSLQIAKDTLSESELSLLLGNIQKFLSNHPYQFANSFFLCDLVKIIDEDFYISPSR